MRTVKALTIGAALASAVAYHFVEAGFGRRLWYRSYVALAGRRTLEDVLREIGPNHRPALQRLFAASQAPYPAREIRVLAFKRERVLEIWAEKARGGYALVRTYPVLAACGGPGPKLREGDLQVPEGVYRLTVLNPNSSYHLSLRVDYPNAFDRGKARGDGRTRLGGDIYLHGKAVSIGCLAIGDPAIEELFVLAADTGLLRMRVVIAPDREMNGETSSSPPWLGELYGRIRAELNRVRGTTAPGNAGR